MEEMKRICYGCMSMIPIESSICPICKLDISKLVQNPRCLRMGTVLHGDYIVGKVIGEGGFGISYIGWNRKTSQRVAIKEYFPSNVSSRDCVNGTSNDIYFFNEADKDVYMEGIEKYIKEAKILKQFNDADGIVSIQDFFFENNTAYIIMEYVEGISLKEYLETNGALSPKDTFELMMPIMLALEKVHKKGVIHRDISPDNIMIRVDGAFKLIDFGAARITDDNGKSLTIILKRGFAPEEQYRTHGNQGPWTDLYALCATMYKMITNVTLPEAMERLIEDDLVPLDQFDVDITAEQARAIEKGLRVKADDRYQSIKELRLALAPKPEREKTLHLIAIMQNEDGKVVAYRVFDRGTESYADYNVDTFIQKFQNAEKKIDNVIIYQQYVQAVGGNIRRYPVVREDGSLTAKNRLYFVEHTLDRGYLCLDYKGRLEQYDEMEMRDLLSSDLISNEDKVGLFIALREKEAVESGGKIVEPSSSMMLQSKEQLEPVKKVHKKSGLMLSSQARETKHASTQLRLRMAKEMHKPNKE